MTRDETLLTDAYRTLAKHWDAWSLGTYLSDFWGRFAFRARHADGDRYLAFVKQHGLHDGKASFMAKGVRCARAERRYLLLFCAEQPSAGTAWVFHPETVHRAGQRFQIESPKRETVDAVELPSREYGAVLGDHLSGRNDPAVVGGVEA